MKNIYLLIILSSSFLQCPRTLEYKAPLSSSFLPLSSSFLPCPMTLEHKVALSSSFLQCPRTLECKVAEENFLKGLTRNFRCQDPEFDDIFNFQNAPELEEDDPELSEVINQAAVLENCLFFFEILEECLQSNDNSPLKDLLEEIKNPKNTDQVKSIAEPLLLEIKKLDFLDPKKVYPEDLNLLDFVELFFEVKAQLKLKHVRALFDRPSRAEELILESLKKRSYLQMYGTRRVLIREIPNLIKILEELLSLDINKKIKDEIADDINAFLIQHQEFVKKEKEEKAKAKAKAKKALI